MRHPQISLDGQEGPPGHGRLVTHPVHIALPTDKASPGLARQLVAIALQGCALEPLTDSALLVVSELTTNALRVTCRCLDLDVWLGDDFLQIGVGDDASGEPMARHPSALQEGGRGMAVVDALVSERQVRRDAAGKVIWCRLDSG
jgi:anti-sigma regulatory factor (Ser/Thr protein kinase)